MDVSCPNCGVYLSMHRRIPSRRHKSRQESVHCPVCDAVVSRCIDGVPVPIVYSVGEYNFTPDINVASPAVPEEPNVPEEPAVLEEPDIPE